jgi:hypothetical protein
MGLKNETLNFMGPAWMVNIVLVGVIEPATIFEKLAMDVRALPNHW